GPPPEYESRQRARATIRGFLDDLGPLLPYLKETEAFQREGTVDGVTYPLVIDLVRLLAHGRARRELVGRGASALRELAGGPGCCLVYRAAKGDRAGVWARALAEALGRPAIPIGTGDSHFLAISHQQKQQLAGCRRLVVVDAAIRTGRTLAAALARLRNDGG